jgi:hypothetical protein
MRRFLLIISSRLVLLLERIRPWHQWPGSRIGLLIITLGIRPQLRIWNLHDLRRHAPKLGPARRGRTEQQLHRDPRGRDNDLNDPEMGMVDGRFGRNFPPSRTHPEAEPGLLEPNPRIVSQRLMVRDEFQPATILNVLAASWIQFMVHGWFNHGTPERENPITLDLADGDSWPPEDRVDGKLAIRRTRHDATWSTEENRPPTYRTATTHWWDGSQLYGSSAERLACVRGSATGGKIELTADGLLPPDGDTGVDLTGFNDDYWVALSLLHHLFALEHNAICDALRRENPHVDDDWIFEHARLINSALLAKIHTVEWTPAILSHPAVKRGMNAAWCGLLGRRFKRKFPNLHFGSALSGMAGSRRKHFGAPYSLTEEFTTVYRLHPLLPDDFNFRSHRDNSHLGDFTLTAIQGPHTQDIRKQFSTADLLYSMGTEHPGAITLHNFPRALQNFVKHIDGEAIRIDLAALDVMRDRERGVPRYNDFRELLRMPRIKRFEDLTNRPEWVATLRDVYDNDIDRVDTQVGMLAEPLPKGFGFSETAFRIFVLMAGRRITSDRFFTDDYRPAVYTKLGIDWVEDNDMASVLLRHFPELTPRLAGVATAFAPWNKAPAAQRGPES